MLLFKKDKRIAQSRLLLWSFLKFPLSNMALKVNQAGLAEVCLCNR